MKRKVLYIILPIFFFFFNVNVALADDSISCAKQQEKIDTYDYLKAQLEGIDCTDNSNQTNVAICNDSSVRKNIIVTDLMKLNDEGHICSEKQDEVDKIIEENKDKCGKIFDDWFSDFVNKFMTLFYILGPILLILFGSLDFAKATVSADQDAIRKAWKDFSKRLAATILLFATPTIVNLIISLNVSDKYLSGNAYSCDFDYLVYTKKYNIKYVPRQDTTTSSGSSSIGGTQVGGYTIFNQFDSAWENDKLLASTDGDTLGNSGCALTAQVIQIVNSGVETTIDLNPRSYNQKLRELGYYGGPTNDWTIWTIPEELTNNKYALKENITISGNITQKAAKLKEYISQGYYPVIQVKDSPLYGGSHYVAVFEVNGSEIVIGDPAGGTLAILNNTSYPIVSETYSSQVVLYYIK